MIHPICVLQRAELTPEEGGTFTLLTWGVSVLRLNEHCR